MPLFVEELTKAVLESGDHDSRVTAVLAAESAADPRDPCYLACLADRAARPARPDRQGGCANWRGARPRVRLRPYRAGGSSALTSELRAGLDRLADAGLLFCRGVGPQSSYLFKHALVQDAAYGTLLRARRQELHTRVAAVLEQHFADLVERQPELLAHYLTAAGDYERAVGQWLKADMKASAGRPGLECHRA